MMSNVLAFGSLFGFTVTSISFKVSMMSGYHSVRKKALSSYCTSTNGVSLLSPVEPKRCFLVPLVMLSMLTPSSFTVVNRFMR